MEQSIENNFEKEYKDKFDEYGSYVKDLKQKAGLKPNKYESIQEIKFENEVIQDRYELHRYWSAKDLQSPRSHHARPKTQRLS